MVVNDYQLILVGCWQVLRSAGSGERVGVFILKQLES